MYPAIFLYTHSYLKVFILGNTMHPKGAQVLKSMHPVAKMCTQGAGCTLNFEHCIGMINSSKNVHTPGAHLRKSCTRRGEMCTRGAGCTFNFGHCLHGCPPDCPTKMS